MTPFMEQIAEVVRAGLAPAAPGLRASHPRPVGVGVHEQTELRALAEQLVSEANTVLAEVHREVELVDEPGPGMLAFTLRSGRSWARVSTRFADGRTWGRLVTPGGGPGERELAGPEALPDLVVALVANAER
ncbi:hypothetical protein [Phytohabitans suffuscus]|uniref:Uncharacterized protein n=1 Tax=Phytohabitans suffuscus TaxID=624315 RepID=A0A6F8YTW5_9ACTN|nr:hypothetical protein [Phytohabitans suffuscus]BCB89509.1 hypothetical protein Psuf_068220 [Phytohabitans suffuscus]